MKKPEIFDYLNYREFLKDFYIYKKSIDSEFSYRAFSEKAGLKSRSFLKMVIDGKKTLSVSLRKNVARVCELEADGAKYFFALIDFNHEKNVEKQTEYFRELHRLSRRVSSKEITGDYNRIISKWYYLAVKSLLVTVDFKPDPGYISKKLRHLITPAEARDAIELLKELDVIREENDRYIITEQHLSTNEETISECVRDYHEQMLNVGSIALDLIPRDEREYLAVTMDVSKERIPFIKERIKKFHQDLLNFIDSDKNSQDVCQLNIQFLKLSGEEN